MIIFHVLAKIITEGAISLAVGIVVLSVIVAVAWIVYDLRVSTENRPLLDHQHTMHALDPDEFTRTKPAATVMSLHIKRVPPPPYDWSQDDSTRTD